MSKSAPPISQTYLSVTDLAERFNCSKDSIYRWKREGDFPRAVKLSPGMVRWKLSDIEDWENKLRTCFMTHLELGDLSEASGA